MNRVWIEIARSDVAQRFATWPWRLGLGWLVGRRLALVSTNAPQGAVRRTLVPAHIIGGDVLLAGLERAHWQEDITARSTVNVQAHPGPLAARVEPLGDSGGDGVTWYRATATGAPAPEMIGPDQIWFWAVAPILWGLRRLRE